MKKKFVNCLWLKFFAKTFLVSWWCLGGCHEGKIEPYDAAAPEWVLEDRVTLENTQDDS